MSFRLSAPGTDRYSGGGRNDQRAHSECFALTLPVRPFLPQDKLAPLTAETDKACGEGGSPEPGYEAGAGAPPPGTRAAEDGSSPTKTGTRDPKCPAIACRDRKTGRCVPRTRTCGNRQLVRLPLMAPCSKPAASCRQSFAAAVFNQSHHTLGVGDGGDLTNLYAPTLADRLQQSNKLSELGAHQPSASQHHCPSHHIWCSIRAFRSWPRCDRESFQQRQACSTKRTAPTWTPASHRKRVCSSDVIVAVSGGLQSSGHESRRWTRSCSPIWQTPA